MSEKPTAAETLLHLFVGYFIIGPLLMLALGLIWLIFGGYKNG